MSLLANRLTIKVRIALVSVAFVAGLGVIGGAYLEGSGDVAASFDDFKALSALEQKTSDIAASTIALKVVSRDVRFRREGTDLQKVIDGAAELSGRIDSLATAPRSAAFGEQITAMKTQIGALTTRIAAAQKLQQALGATESGGLVDQVEQSGQTLTTRLKALISEDDTIDAERMLGALTTMLRVQAEFKSTFDDSLTGEWEVNFGRFDRTLTRAAIPREAKEALGAAFKKYADIFRVWSATEKDFMLAAENVTGSFDVIGPILQDLDSKAAAEGEAAGARLAAAEALTKKIILATILLALAGGLASALIVGRTTAKPLSQLRDAMLGLAGGDLETKIPALGRADEIGQMAKAVLTLKEAALDRVRLEGEAQDNRGKSDAERQRNEAERARLAKEQERVVAIIAGGHEQLSQGNLTFRIDEVFPPAYQKLKDDFNAALGQMQRTMKVILQATEGIRTAANEVSQASEDLSRRTERQAASLEETAAALDQITVRVKKAADGASHARGVVGAADGDAKKGAIVVRQAVDAINCIAKSARQISQIIGVIDEIAFQTNLLALNAGVEAARAGDAGRGFAVVASEVRALAQRSAEAAKEIKGLISTSTMQVDQGVQLFAETGEAFERIMAQVIEINEVVGEIAVGATEQATGLEEVNAAINQIDQVTQQNAAMVEQSTAASRLLSEETTQLSNLVGQFQVADAGDVEAMRRQLQKTAPHAFPKPGRAAAGQDARAEPGKATPRLLRAAPKAKFANGAGHWKEF
jgi:methyl-accepting chemotaxis protein